MSKAMLYSLNFFVAHELLVNRPSYKITKSPKLTKFESQSKLEQLLTRSGYGIEILVKFTPRKMSNVFTTPKVNILQRALTLSKYIHIGSKYRLTYEVLCFKGLI